MDMSKLSTDELILKLSEGGLCMTSEEEQTFRENEVDGETVQLGLTDAMLDHLFKGSFKKQFKFLQIMRQIQPGHRETCPTQNTQPNTEEMDTEEMHTITFQVLDVDAATSSQAAGRLPDVFVLPSFPKELQAKLDDKEGVQRVPQYRHKIIRVLHETVAMYTMYPTHAEYVKVAQALIQTYPFLKDVTGNGYDEPNTPYPVVQVTQEDWKSAFEGQSLCSLMVDRVRVCEAMKVEEAIMSSFIPYFVFNLEYQP